MEKVVYTPRLKLILLETAERGSVEFDWLHKIRSNEKSTFWSLTSTSKVPEDTERAIKKYMPPPPDGKTKSYRIVYAVHEILTRATDGVAETTDFIGLVNVAAIKEDGVTLPIDLTLPADESSSTLSAEVAYMFLPEAWNKGYATESIGAVLDACRTAPAAADFWAPYTKVHCRAIVNSRNGASMRVMEKVGMPKWGVYEWRGDRPMFMGGIWTATDDLPLYAKYIFGDE